MSPEAEGRVPITRIVALARPELRRLTFGTLFLIVGSGMGLAYPQAIRLIIDSALTGGTLSIDRAALAIVAIFCVQSIAVALRYVLFTVAGERIVTRLRADLYASIVTQEIAFFDQRRTGELMQQDGVYRRLVRRQFVDAG